MAPLGDLELMIQSRYPFIAVETSEEDRLETTLSQVAGDLRARRRSPPCASGRATGR